MTNAAALVERAGELQREVKAHKKAIDTHRKGLRVAATELAELEAHAARLGLELHLSPGVGVIHGRTDDTHKASRSRPQSTD